MSDNNASSTEVSSPYMCCGGTVATIQGCAGPYTGSRHSRMRIAFSAELREKLRHNFV